MLAHVVDDDGDMGALVLPFRASGDPVATADAFVEEMLQGFADQQRARSLNLATIHARDRQVRRFMEFYGSMPWEWGPVDVEDWTTHLVSEPRPVATSTVRAYQQAVALFCDYLVDPRYGWGERSMEMFGSHPVQIFHEWNTTAHVIETEARPQVRPLTRVEVQRLLDHADERAFQAYGSGRKGWATAYRDATLFKVIYAFGPRRREAAMLDVYDFTRNPAAPEFGKYGVCNVRWGKASRGSGPRRRGVVAVHRWASEALAQYVEQVRPQFQTTSPALWPTERQGRVSSHHVDRRFAQWREELGLDPLLHPHCLRHSYVTHLIEDGFDHRFVQEQAGHRWGSTTALYTGVSGDYRNQVVRQALDRAFTPPTERPNDEPSNEDG